MVVDGTIANDCVVVMVCGMVVFVMMTVAWGRVSEVIEAVTKQPLGKTPCVKLGITKFMLSCCGYSW